MKTFLFSLFLLCSSVCSFAQLRINEIYSEPVNGDVNKEFVELAMDPNSSAGEDVDSYILLSYFDDGLQKGFYVIDMPNSLVPPGGVVLAAAGGKGAQYQDNQTFTRTPLCNWNGNLTVINGSANKFVVTNGNWNSGASIRNMNVNDLFSPTPAMDGFRDLVVLLFRKNGTDLEMVDGFIGSEAEDRFELPAYIQTLPALTVNLSQLNKARETFTIDFNSLSSLELGAVPAADFLADEGYYFCGSWDQPISGQYLTPGSSNTPLQGTPLQAFTTCDPQDNMVSFNVISGQVSVYPIAASLYIDENENLRVDAGDTKYGQTVVRTQGRTYSMAKPVGNNFILVLDGAGQCFDDVIPFFCDAAIVTPVNFAGFNALRKGSIVQLAWKTASENNNKGFYVERRKGAKDSWQTLGFVDSKAPGGISTSTLSYTFSDANASSGITQYRLLQLDHDGKSKYSTVVSVRGLEQAEDVTVYPNPSADGVLNVVFDGATAVRDVIVTDMVGRVVRQYKGISSSSLQITGLNTGMFNIMIQNTQSGKRIIARATVTNGN